ncbi:hypothetical protein AB0E81_31305 [Streptomyces sp. NPDC033538]|uniref:hypothetical protein n=1 Tax=Streptomyces sp. NPDC033538 TaxID=3155367 RepID=UPI0033DEF48F
MTEGRRQPLLPGPHLRVAAGAECSVAGLYATFGGRGEPLRAVFERYSPTVDVEQFLATAQGDLEDAMRRLTRLMVDTLEREPRVRPPSWRRSSPAPATTTS